MPRPDILPVKVALSDDQRTAFDEAESLVTNAMAELGETYLEYEEVRQAFENVEKKLRSRSASARRHEKRRADVVSAIVAMLNLKEGDWVYDGNGNMLKKESYNG